MKFCHVAIAVLGTLAATNAYHGDKASPKAMNDTPLKNAALNARNSLDKGATKVCCNVHPPSCVMLCHTQYHEQKLVAVTLRNTS
jgi:hypothetical protein